MTAPVKGRRAAPARAGSASEDDADTRAEVQTVDDPTATPAGRELRVVETERIAQQELLTMLRLVDQQKIRVGKTTGRPGTGALAIFSDHLVGGDFYGVDHPSGEAVGPMRAFAWPLVLQAAGLVQIAGTHLELTARGRRALGRPAAEALGKAWSRWVNCRAFDEFNRVEAIKGQGGRRRLTAVIERRKVIERALQGCPVQRWIPIEELWRHMQATRQTFSVARDPWKLYICDPHYGSLGYTGFHRWELLEGRFSMALLFEYAATLGLVDVAYGAPERARHDYRGNWGTDELLYLSRYDGLACFRINPLGAWALGMASSYETAASPPETVEAPPTEVAGRSRFIELAGHALVFACADAAIAKQIAHACAERRLCHRMGQRLLVVPAELESAFRGAARRLGYPIAP